MESQTIGYAPIREIAALLLVPFLVGGFWHRQKAVADAVPANLFDESADNAEIRFQHPLLFEDGFAGVLGELFFAELRPRQK